MSEGIKKKTWSIVVVVLAFFFGMLLSGLWNDSVYTALVEHIKATVPGGREEWIQAHNTWISTWDWLVLAGEMLLKIGLVLLLFRVFLKYKVKDLGRYFPRDGMKKFCGGLLLGIAAITTVFLILIATGNARVVSWTPTISVSLLQYLLVFILVGFGEELLLRGFVIEKLKVFQNRALIIFISSFLFSILHIYNSNFDWMAFLNITLVGILFAYLYLKSGSLWVPIGYHITWNYFQGNVFGLPVSGLDLPGMLTTEYPTFTILNGGGFGPEAGLVSTAITLVILVCVWLYYRNRPQTPAF